MNNYGLSNLEIKYIIERALLPDRCVFSEHDGLHTLRVTPHNHPLQSVILPDLDFKYLSTSRAIAELIGDVRYRLADASTQKNKFAFNKRVK
ncbi:Uncharacterized protein ALO94_03576 [Pseudomonas syringae pv. spinaceae]|uniref:Uncharacterized protein n=1 Tax=Pseudomonas syringae pv. spinaceae TaxID=264459 RepID=A0A0Q0BX65_PSESX|nr:DUF1652 domain-containing protein [Pseudomonas syringae]KPY79975.1 Uncharacterized protein ALO94_03576 [Pseudomonas syringae pv. spinaceae]